MKIISPVDGSVYAERDRASDAAVDAALENAVSAQRRWKQVPVAERAALCRRMVEWCVERADILGGDNVDEGVRIALDVLRRFERGAEAGDDDDVFLVLDRFRSAARGLLFGFGIGFLRQRGGAEPEAKGKPGHGSKRHAADVHTIRGIQAEAGQGTLPYAAGCSRSSTSPPVASL